MSQADSSGEDAQAIVAHKIRHAAGLQALRKIGRIVAQEQQSEAEKVTVLRWLIRYGWILAVAAIGVLAKLTGVF